MCKTIRCQAQHRHHTGCTLQRYWLMAKVIQHSHFLNGGYTDIAPKGSTFKWSSMVIVSFFLKSVLDTTRQLWRPLAADRRGQVGEDSRSRVGDGVRWVSVRLGQLHGGLCRRMVIIVKKLKRQSVSSWGGSSAPVKPSASKDLAKLHKWSDKKAVAQCSLVQGHKGKWCHVNVQLLHYSPLSQEKGE